ncbi:MAG: hypothetical protein ACJ76X_06375 [Solirubrobacteraceae bacterium]
MILYYALGGGLGHLTRAQRVLSALGLTDRAALLTSSRFARDERVVGELPVIEVPTGLGRDRAAFQRWLLETLRALAPEELIVDAFPGGILGELCELELPPARYVARRLRWPAYRRRLPGRLPRYELAHALEPLVSAHALALEACASRVEALDLVGPDAGEPLLDRPHTLVVHSGPDDEVAALAEYARELEPSCPLLVITPRRPAWLPARAVWHDVYPAAPHMPFAELVVTAAGFNALHDVGAASERHRVIPFPRPLDDQFARARYVRTSEPKLTTWSLGSSPPLPSGPSARRSSLGAAS